MISYLSGSLFNIDLRFVIVLVNGVGYKVYLGEEALQSLSQSVGKPITLWTYTVVREDVLDLYGFINKNELDFFEHLISVSGIGPKSALAIMNGTSIDTLKDGIVSGDPTLLTKVSGIGKKSAEKIILELRDKFANHVQTNTLGSGKEGSFAIDALIALGYNEREVRDILKKIPKDITRSQDIVKEAIKLLGKE